MIVITFLGTVSGIPTKERSHPAIVLEYFSKHKETLLFDCGEGTQVQFMKAGISFMQVEKIFITHWHADHFAGLIPLLATYSLEKRKNELKIFAPEATKFVSKILELGYFGLRFKVTPIDVPFSGNEPSLIDETKNYRIFSIPVEHTVPAVAYCFHEKDRWSIDEEKLRERGLKRGRWLRKLKEEGVATYQGQVIRVEVARIRKGLKVVYTGDTKPCENVVKLSKDADLLIHDGTFLEVDEANGKGHADVAQAAEVAKKANVKRLILTNISRRYTNLMELEERAREIFPSTQVARDLMRVTLRNEIV